jgi:hypothetical protein
VDKLRDRHAALLLVAVSAGDGGANSRFCPSIMHIIPRSAHQQRCEHELFSAQQELQVRFLQCQDRPIRYLLLTVAFSPRTIAISSLGQSFFPLSFCCPESMHPGLTVAALLMMIMTLVYAENVE